eukprot:4653671-Alexandrium_andersonii.AAC.1
MSASLVGSEMCIRDSPASARTIVQNAPNCELRELCLRSFLGPRSSSAVSYTHLTLPTICSV